MGLEMENYIKHLTILTIQKTVKTLDIIYNKICWIHDLVLL